MLVGVERDVAAARASGPAADAAASSVRAAGPDAVVVVGRLRSRAPRARRRGRRSRCRRAAAAMTTAPSSDWLNSSQSADGRGEAELAPAAPAPTATSADVEVRSASKPVVEEALQLVARLELAASRRRARARTAAQSVHESRSASAGASDDGPLELRLCRGAPPAARRRRRPRRAEHGATTGDRVVTALRTRPSSSWPGGVRLTPCADVPRARRDVRAAGAVVSRRGAVLLVHRPALRRLVVPQGQARPRRAPARGGRPRGRRGDRAARPAGPAAAPPALPATAGG